jgi:HPt (histidine-containing phosphotransfer) domain-containing protein
MPVLTETLIRWLPADKVRQISQEILISDDNGAFDDFYKAMSVIDEIDTEVGLRRVNGIKGMYIDNVKIFNKKLAGDAEKMSVYLRDGDIKAFSVIVHAMKSALASVGAAGLSDVAFRLEIASKNNEAGYCNAYFPDFMNSLITLQEKLSLIFPEEDSTIKKQEGDTAYLAENVQKSLEAINDFDIDKSIDIINSLTLYDFGDDINACLTDAILALKQYNYDEAKNCLINL